ncbi:MAG TPA: peptidoglycan DD-metalloendopeptidase family protein [Bacteroidales bacterium]|nr:peptidoglycan DD-metalloendopeptidase family protein [Bacteroidales bacterium]
MFFPKFIIKSVLLLGLFTIMAIANPLFSQNKKEKLEENKKKIEQEIQYNTKLLDETKKTKSTTLNQLVILKKQIADRERLINNINEEIQTTNQQIELNNEILADLKKDLLHLKEEYAQMIYYAYKNRDSFDRLMFIFSARDFNQAFRRVKYFQQYAAYRETQAELIVKTQDDIAATIQNLENFRNEKFTLLTRLEEERDKLNQERSLQNKTYQTLTKKEKELAATIKEKEKAAKKLQSEIEKIIAEEIRLASEKSGTTSTGTFALTPDEMELSASFQQNQGGLPWPVERGIISSTFGEHAHPVLKEVKTKNNGVDILTDEGMEARAVFGGEVTRVMSIPNYNYVVMIRHGEFLTVYSNLTEVYVTRGQKIDTKQAIGKIYTDTKDQKTELHFELWKGKTLLNPEGWLAK